MTFSIVGRCGLTGMLGLVVTSSSPCVASRCAWARAAVGAVATQNVTDPRLGAWALDLMAAGNLLATPEVPAAMVASFESGREEHLAERLLQALEAGLAAGGEEGPVKSAGLLVVHELDWPLVELRQDWRDADVIPALRQAWEVYRPQMDDYVMRALDPSSAPSYGVPGDP